MFSEATRGRLSFIAAGALVFLFPLAYSPYGADMFDLPKVAVLAVLAGVVGLAPRRSAPRGETLAITLTIFTLLTLISALASPVRVEALIGSYERRIGAVELVYLAVAAYGIANVMAGRARNTAAQPGEPGDLSALGGEKGRATLATTATLSTPDTSSGRRARVSEHRSAQAAQGVPPATLANRLGALYSQAPLETLALASVILLSLIAVLQAAGLFGGAETFEGRAFATAGNPVFLGAFLALAIPLALRILALERLVGGIAIVAILAGIAASGSRVAALAALGALVVAAIAVAIEARGGGGAGIEASISPALGSRNAKQTANVTPASKRASSSKTSDAKISKAKVTKAKPTSAKTSTARSANGRSKGAGRASGKRAGSRAASPRSLYGLATIVLIGALVFAVVFGLLYAPRVRALAHDARQRLDLIAVGAAGIREKPLSGHGWGRYEAYFRLHAPGSWSFAPDASEVPDSSHSAIVDIAFSSGIPAACAFLAALLVSLFVAASFRGRAGGREGAARLHLDGASLAFLVVALTLVFFVPATFSVLAWMLLVGMLVGGNGRGLVSAASAAPAAPEVPEIPLSRRDIRRRAIVRAVGIAAAIVLSLGALAASVFALRADAQLGTALRFESAGNLSEAQDAAQRATDLFPYEKQYFVKAAGYAFAGEQPTTSTVELAIRYADRALVLDPYCFEAHFIRGLSLVALGDLGDPAGYESALAELKVCRYLCPRDPQVRYYLGLTEAVTGDEVGAERSWKAAIALWPRYTEAYFALGYLKEKAGKQQEAIAYYEKALANATPADRQAIQEALDRIRSSKDGK